MNDQAPVPPKPSGDPTPVRAPMWVRIVGVVFLGIAVLFFIVLSFLALYTNVDLCRARFPILVVIALVIAIGLGFLGGAAALEGKIPIPKSIYSPFKFGVSGGVGAFLIVLLVGNLVWECSASPRIMISQVEVLRDTPTSAKVLVHFSANSLTERHHLVLEIASAGNFEHSMIRTDEISDWTAGQAITQFDDKEVRKIWTRIRAMDDNEQEVATSPVVELEIPKQ